MNDVNWYFTEFNWAKGTGNGGVIYAQAVNPGAYFKVSNILNFVVVIY